MSKQITKEAIQIVNKFFYDIKISQNKEKSKRQDRKLEALWLIGKQGEWKEGS